MLFQEERENTATPIMLNEKAILQLGYKDPQAAVDKLIKFGLGPRDWVEKSLV